MGAFLTGHSMTIKVGRRGLTAGLYLQEPPLASVLGCYLFNVAVDELELGHSSTEAPNKQQETLSHNQDFPISLPFQLLYK